jgi:hypothetical protein
MKSFEQTFLTQQPITQKLLQTIRAYWGSTKANRSYTTDGVTTPSEPIAGEALTHLWSKKIGQ